MSPRRISEVRAVSDSAESVGSTVRSLVTTSLTSPFWRGSAVVEGVWESLNGVTPDTHDCLVCGDLVFEFEVCYDCEQQYYPPRQYWQEVSA
jgi:hypothetical protein